MSRNRANSHKRQYISPENYTSNTDTNDQQSSQPPLAGTLSSNMESFKKYKLPEKESKNNVEDTNTTNSNIRFVGDMVDLRGSEIRDSFDDIDPKTLDLLMSNDYTSMGTLSTSKNSYVDHELNKSFSIHGDYSGTSNPESKINNDSSLSGISGVNVFNGISSSDQMIGNLSAAIASLIRQSKVSPIVSGSMHSESNTTQLINNPEDAFVKLIPLINKVESTNFGDIIIEALSHCRHQLPLDDLYNLLYNCESPEKLGFTPLDSTRIDKSQPILRVEALKYCYFILEIFRSPGKSPASFGSHLVNNMGLGSVNLHEFLRVFLAVKIISDFMTPIEDTLLTQNSLSRIAIYKMYYIVCNTLIEKYPTSSNSSRLQRNLVLGQSQIGKLTKSVFPNLRTKRIGKRGKSRYHYLGMTWNKSIISEKLLHMVELDLPELEKIFTISHNREAITKEKLPVQVKLQVLKHHNSAPSIEKLPLIFEKPFYSFVSVSSFFNGFNCSPRIWKIVPGTRPELSAWAKATIKKCLSDLESYNIKIDHLVHKFMTGLISFNLCEEFFSNIPSLILQLSNHPSPKQAYLNLYLIVALLVYPNILSSKQEISCDARGQLRQSLNSFISHLEKELESFSLSEEMGLKKFTTLLKRMSNLNLVLSTRVKTLHAVNVIREVISGVRQLITQTHGPFEEKSRLSQIIISAVFTASKAYRIDLKLEDDKDYSTFLKKVVQTFTNLVTEVVKSISKIPSSMSEEDLKSESYDLPWQIFVISSRLFHDVFLLDPSVIRLPMPVIRFVLLQIMNEIQLVDFRNFGKRNNVLSQETFKTWWVYSMISQEYYCVFAEVAALYQDLCNISEG